jgi:hypothetical protein
MTHHLLLLLLLLPTLLLLVRQSRLEATHGVPLWNASSSPRWRNVAYLHIHETVTDASRGFSRWTQFYL